MKKLFTSTLLTVGLMLSTLTFAQQSVTPVTTQPEVRTETVIAQKDTTSQTFLQKAETNSVQTIDGFLTKYEPKVSNQLGKLWDFTKSTTSSLYKAFVRYLIAKDSFPIVIGLLLIWLVYLVTQKLKTIGSKSDVLFPQIEEKESFTEYQGEMVKKDNKRNMVYRLITKFVTDNVFYVALVVILWKMIPYFYNLTLLLVAPEARVLIEITNLYKSF